jgi:hypothetical protein
MKNNFSKKSSKTFDIPKIVIWTQDKILYLKPLLHLVDSCRLKEDDLGAREYEIKSGVIPNNNMGHTYGNNIWRNI